MALFNKNRSRAPATKTYVRELVFEDDIFRSVNIFDVANEVAESIAGYIGAINITSNNKLSKISNNTAFIFDLVRFALHHNETYVYNSSTYGWLFTDSVILTNNTSREGIIQVNATFELPKPFTESAVIEFPIDKLGIIKTTMVDVSTSSADALLLEAYNAVLKKLGDTGKIKAFIESDLDTGLDKMKEAADDELAKMLSTANNSNGFTFIESGKNITQMMPDYSTSNISDFDSVRNFAASQLSVSPKILDGSATDGEKAAVIYRFIIPILKQFKEYENSIEWKVIDEFFTAYMTTGGMLNNNRIENWGKGGNA